jgi:hypothetical protein
VYDNNNLRILTQKAKTMIATPEGHLTLIQIEDTASHSRGGQYWIPTDAWDTDSLARCAEFHHHFIHTAETLLTLSYWSMGRALELLHAKLTVRQFGQVLQDYGIHKVRASKARAIARFYTTPEELEGVSVQDAYQAAIKNRREQEPPQSENPQDGEIALPETTPAVIDKATATLTTINAQLGQLAEDLAADGPGKEEAAPQLVPEIDRAIATLLLIKNTVIG